MGQLKLDNVRKSFGSIEVIKGVSLDVPHGEFVVFVGPSGCGKSTLLRMIAGLEEITAGNVEIEGKIVNDLAPVKRGIAMVFQSYALYPHMTVFENIAFPLRVEKLPQAEVEAKVSEASGILKLDDRLKHKPGQLSGGQRQRVAIGRAIVRQPSVFLFDEPLSNLDAALRAEMRVELAKLHNELDATMIYVTHDQVEAMTMADRIVVLDDGVIAQVGTPLELYHRPENIFVAGFIGNPKMNFLSVDCLGSDKKGTKVRFADGAELLVPVVPREGLKGKKLTLGLRPEHARLDGGEANISITPSVIERLGIHTVVYANMDEGGEYISCLLPGSAPVEVGKSSSIGVDAENCHLFDDKGDALTRTNELSAIDESLLTHK